MNKVSLLFIFILLLEFEALSQNNNDILNLLVANKNITQEQADSLRAEAAIKQQETEANRKSFFINAARQMQLSGFTQVRYRAVEEEGKVSGSDIRRARLDLRGNITPYWTYRLQTEFATGPKLIDAYSEYKFRDWLNFTVGQFKIPFSQESLISSNKLDMIDRAQVVEAMVYRGADIVGNQNGRDIGLMAGGSFIKVQNRYLFDYRLGVFNGSGIKDFTDKDNGKDIVMRLIFHPIKGLDIGISDFYGHDSIFFSSSDHRYLERKRIGLEAVYEFKRISARGEFISGDDGDIHRSGFYAQGGFFVIPQKLQFLFRYDQFDPDTSKNSDRKSEISTLYVFNVNYNFNPFARIQAGYAIKKEEITEIKNNYLQVQFQIGF